MALGAQHGARREGRVGLSQPSIPGAALDQIPASSPEPCTRAPHTQGLCQHPSAAEPIFFPPNCTLRVVLEWFKWDKIPPPSTWHHCGLPALQAEVSQKSWEVWRMFYPKNPSNALQNNQEELYWDQSSSSIWHWFVLTLLPQNHGHKMVPKPGNKIRE